MITIDCNDVDQDILLFCAFRYALGRRTYVVSTIIEIILENWDNIPVNRQEMFKSEIREAISKNNAGSKYDVEEWGKILKR